MLCYVDSENSPADSVSALSTPAVSKVQSRFPEVNEEWQMCPSGYVTNAIADGFFYRAVASQKQGGKRE